MKKKKNIEGSFKCALYKLRKFNCEIGKLPSSIPGFFMPEVVCDTESISGAQFLTVPKL